jgi:hypothetical protein
MNFPKWAVLTMAAMFAAAAAPAFALAAQQNPDSAATPAPTAAKPPAPTAASATAAETDDTAALIAQANATAAANAKAEAASAAPVVKEPSAEARKKAREYGFHAEIYDGKTMFCRDDATLGTRIGSKRCMNSEDFEDYGRMLQIARDTMKAKNQCQGGGLCGGLQ